VLRNIRGPKRKEIAGGWRRLHNEELHNLYASPNIIRVIKSRSMRWVRACNTHEMINAYNLLVGKPERNRPLGRPRRRREDNIKWYLRKIGCEGAEWFHMAQYRDQRRALVETVMNLRVP
jgi:hypothetical protein